jgi:hypothetical protein
VPFSAAAPDWGKTLNSATSWSTTSFLELMAGEEARRETYYAISQRAGVRGFPRLAAGPNAEGLYGAVTRGYAPPEQILGILEAWLAGPTGAQAVD